MSEEGIKERAEAYMKRERRPVGLLELRRILGVPPRDAASLTKLLKSDRRFYRVGSLWYVRKAPLKIKVRLCPNCGHRSVKFEGGFYSCPNCELKFHFTWLL